MPFIQDLVHKLEVGGGMRYVRIGLSILAILAMVAAYNWRAFRNMATEEAMDSAQVARNVAQGKGFSTLFIRPFSIHLIKNWQQRKLGPAASADPAQLRQMHPDIANPPVYPVVLAAMMKSLPRFFHTNPSGKNFWGSGGRMWYKGDFMISLFNQALFLALIVSVFFWARQLFDPSVAWLSALLLLGTELFWRFSVSGLSTMLLMLIFMVLVWSLTLLEREAVEPKWGTKWLLVLAAIVGASVAVGALTRYAFGWVIVPALAFVVLFGGAKRVTLALLALVVFVVIMTPWMLRNYKICGNPFGTAGYAILETTDLFPEHRLERALEPDFSTFFIGVFWKKFITNSREILHTALPTLGGPWLTAFFLVGLLLPFRKSGLNRLRYF